MKIYLYFYMLPILNVEGEINYIIHKIKCIYKGKSFRVRILWKKNVLSRLKVSDLILINGIFNFHTVKHSAWFHFVCTS